MNHDDDDSNPPFRPPPSGDPHAFLNAAPSPPQRKAPLRRVGWDGRRKERGRPRAGRQRASHGEGRLGGGGGGGGAESSDEAHPAQAPHKLLRAPGDLSAAPVARAEDGGGAATINVGSVAHDSLYKKGCALSQRGTASVRTLLWNDVRDKCGEARPSLGAAATMDSNKRMKTDQSEPEVVDGFEASRLFSQGLSYTYDDVIFHPGHIYFPAEKVDLSTRVSKNVKLSTPMVSSPMDTGKTAAGIT
eukprot:scaffold993_cov393-Prasinococcus_capsulatus_cf.AAC.10